MRLYIQAPRSPYGSDASLLSACIPVRKPKIVMITGDHDFASHRNHRELEEIQTGVIVAARMDQRSTSQAFPFWSVNPLPIRPWNGSSGGVVKRKRNNVRLQDGVDIVGVHNPGLACRSSANLSLGRRFSLGRLGEVIVCLTNAARCMRLTFHHHSVGLLRATRSEELSTPYSDIVLHRAECCCCQGHAI